MKKYYYEFGRRDDDRYREDYRGDYGRSGYNRSDYRPGYYRDSYDSYDGARTDMRRGRSPSTGRYVRMGDYDDNLEDVQRMGFAQTSGGSYRQDAEEYVRRMRNADGSTGEHWSIDQIRQVCPDADPVEMYIAMNMMYSDYYKVAKKYGVNSTDFYCDLAKAFCEDPDGPEDKVQRYVYAMMD